MPWSWGHVGLSSGFYPGKKKMDQKTLNELVAKAELLGFDTEELIYVDQNRPDA
jgi:hypothetical protein